ncbi:MAG: hypothetical protein M1812_003262 [Candelaria pacifica]|nr:MAG: hypothetical protein M1812_003262 [Candelaria pacifica]
MSTDKNAQTPAQANEFAITDSSAVVSGLSGSNQIPAVHRTWILQQYRANNYAKARHTPSPLISPAVSFENLGNLHKNAQTKSAMVVQVDITYAGTRGNKSTYELHIMLDVDVPPAGSTQAPHIGWEVKLNGQRMGNGHDWLPVGEFKIGRPAPGSELFPFISFPFSRGAFEGVVGYLTPLETYPIAPEDKDFGNDGKVVAAGSFRRYKS